jgi:glycosyltransferase involved in cell wall biosynthesis
MVTYISWAPHCSRSDYTARELNGVSHMVYWARLGSRPSTILLKYLGQAVQTWQILIRERPEAVFVMSPPVIAGLVAYPYCALRRIPLVIDAHTGAFQAARWRHFLWLQHWLCRRAATTIVAHADYAEQLSRLGADATVVPDVPIDYPKSDVSFKAGQFLVAVICSFDRDEPIDVIMDSARAVPDVRFLVTGNPKKMTYRAADVPPNLSLTGFLDTPDYGRLLRDADVVMVLTTHMQVMQRGAYEAIYEGTPVIVSRSPVLEREFTAGAILVENTVASVTDAIRRMQADGDRYRRGAQELRRFKQQRWQQTKQVLLSKLGRGHRVASSGVPVPAAAITDSGSDRRTP